MLKWLGAGLIILAGTCFGFYQASALAARPKQLRLLLHALKRLETEISYGMTPLPEAFLHLGRQLKGPVGALFLQAGEELAAGRGKTVGEIWSESVAEAWPRTAMKQAEREMLERLGGTLGISDAGDQVKHLRLCMAELQTEEAAAREDQRRYETMWRSLGPLIGVLVVILMF